MKTNRPHYVILFTALVTSAFTAAVMIAQIAAAEKIKRNEALGYERALLELFDLGRPDQLSDQQIADIIKAHIDRGRHVQDPKSGRVFEVIRAYSRPPEVLGIAVQISGRGFWAPISALVALSPDLSKVTGVVFLEHKETPGLGGRITEPWFQDQFKGLDMGSATGTQKLIYMVKRRPQDPSNPRYHRSVEAITGATQTSAAVERLMNQNLRQFRRAMLAK